MRAGVLAAALVLAALAAAQAAWLLADARVRPMLVAWARRMRGVLRDPQARQGARRASEGLRGLAGRVLAGADRRHGRGRGREVRSRCLDELPELLDVVALGLSAGISFDAAVDIYCGRYHTMLAGRLSEAMRCWRLGLKSRSEALGELADELGVDAFTTFAATVSESIELGAPLAEVLVEQGEAVRERWRSEQQEAIEKAPVKMLIPMGTLALPAMLVAIVGPLFASFGAGS